MHHLNSLNRVLSLWTDGEDCSVTKDIPFGASYSWPSGPCTKTRSSLAGAPILKIENFPVGWLFARRSRAN